MKDKLNPEDLTLFHQAMRDVKPLPKHKTRISSPPPPPSPIGKPKFIQKDYPCNPFSDYEYLNAVSSHEMIEFIGPGVSNRMMRQLRRGTQVIQAVLDLHSQTVEEARSVLHQFLVNCQKQGYIWVLIIHGKGREKAKPILKNKLNHWLRQANQVLAFTSAKIKDGGTGALYLRLRRE